MGKFFLALLLVTSTLFSVGSCTKSPTPKAASNALPDTIRILTYNVENLFDLVNNGGEYPEFVPGQQNWNKGTHAAKVRNVASVIAAARPDIAVLCEIENANALGELCEALQHAGVAYPEAIIGDRPNPTNTCPVILSRFPVARTAFYPGPLLDKGFSRNTVEADVVIAKDTLKVFAVHWPSKGNHDSLRHVAAGILSTRLRQLPSGIDYLVAGDFNVDYDEACAGIGHADPLGHELGTLRSLPGAPCDYVDQRELSLPSTRLVHYDAWLELPETQRRSYVYKRKNSTPDHILLSPALFDPHCLSYADGSFQVFSWDGRILRDGAPFRWSMSYRNKKKYHRGEGYSDHLPLLVGIVRTPFVAAPDAAR